MTYGMNEKYINAIVTAARYDIQRGAGREQVLNSLSRVVDRDLFLQVRERL